MTDLPTVQGLIDAHKAAMDLFDSSPQEIWDYPSDEAEAIDDQLNKTAWALCSYRPTTIEGVHLKATYMMSSDTFVGDEDHDPQFTHAQLVSGFLPALAA
ncbi:hypothetical protein [Sinorhizobium fredii]|uniref:hypothetical protein n=1 Tax=Rhizobium fredii TaxID=380 RepID=UPI003519BBB9